LSSKFTRHLRKRLTGFTLIEMMAVLVLTALLAGVVLPSFQHWFEGLETRSESTDVSSRLQRLFARTALLGIDLTLNASTVNTTLPDGHAALELPRGWQLAAGASLQFSASGFCKPAQLAMVSPRGRLVFSVDATTCAVSARPELGVRS